MYQIGVDIGGTSMKIGLVDEQMQIVHSSSIPFVKEDGQMVAKRLAEAIGALLTLAQVDISQVQSIGIVIPGSIDPTGEHIINAHNLGFHDVPFRSYVAEFFPSVPVFMANDANGAALAELCKGAFVGTKTAVLITLGTGVGGGIILGGKMFNGGMNQGVELGHMPLVGGGEPCSCGNRGCIEAYCSASALARDGVRAMREHPESLLAVKSGGDASLVDAKFVTDCAKENDPAAVAVFDEFVDKLAFACASFFNLLDPEVIAIGGGLCAAGDFLFEPLREKCRPKCFYKKTGKILPAAMGNDAGIIGAAMLQKDAQLR